MNKNKVKCIVTGGAGFIGSHLVEELVRRNYEVTVLDNLSTGRKANLNSCLSKIRFVKIDLSQKNKKWEMEFKKCKYVFHLAALADIVPSIVEPDTYYHSNVTATLNVLEACKKYAVKKIIYSASSSCYGIPRKYPTSENSDLDPKYPYAFTKLMAEKLIIHWSNLYNINYISLRLFNVYGTRSRTSGTYGAVFGVFLAQVINKKPLTVVGTGNQTRDFTYVSDVVNAMLKSATSKVKNNIFNVGSGNTISINKIALLLTSRKYPMISIPKRPGEPYQTFADIKKIKFYLKWEPKINIEEGIDNIKQNIDYWKNAPVWTPSKISNATKDWFKYLDNK